MSFNGLANDNARAGEPTWACRRQPDHTPGDRDRAARMYQLLARQARSRATDADLAAVADGQGRCGTAGADLAAVAHGQGRGGTTGTDLAGVAHGQGRCGTAGADLAAVAHGQGLSRTTGADLAAVANGQARRGAADTDGLCRANFHCLPVVSSPLEVLLR